ncbi:MAG TPA: hypothetical protein VH853_23120, partial [Polyangia bacterium]|nr:hypothetical protein [Polyangia bacterium]
VRPKVARAARTAAARLKGLESREYLSRIIFNPDEVGAQFQALRTADARREIESLIIRLYFERRRLKAESAAADDLDMLPGSKRELRIAEIEAELDALTGGAFTRLARHRPIEGESQPEP